MDNDDEAWGIVANHLDGDSAISPGSQCWVVWQNRGGGCDTNEMFARSRGSRWIRKWIPADRLGNWRVKWVPPRLRTMVYHVADKDEARAALAGMARCWRMDERQVSVKEA